MSATYHQNVPRDFIFSQRLSVSRVEDELAAMKDHSVHLEISGGESSCRDLSSALSKRSGTSAHVWCARDPGIARAAGHLGVLLTFSGAKIF